MITFAAGSIVSLSTLVKVVVGALAAGIGVTIAFSSLIYFIDRSENLRRESRPGLARAFQAASGVAVLACVGIVAYGLVLVASKPK